MNIVPTSLKGAFIVEPRYLEDERGAFIKVFHEETFASHNLETAFVESYYSTSKKDVIRGMHFQTPPADHAKLVYVTRGSITDVIVDIRKGSPTYGAHFSEVLSAANHRAVYIPRGFAHGFLSLEDDTIVTYLQTSMHSPTCDGGIHFTSLGFEWGVQNPIVSPRDQQFPTLTEFVTPFGESSSPHS